MATDSRKPTGESSFRFNLSIPSNLKTEVLEAMEASSIYNGLADFLGCALREFISSFSENANRYLDGMIEQYKNPQDAIRMFNMGLSRLGSALYEEYASLYPGKLDTQISLRLSPPFYAAMNEAMKYLGLGIQELARVALSEYVSRSPAGEASVFTIGERIDELASKIVEHGEFDLERGLYEDLLASMHRSRNGPSEKAWTDRIRHG